MKQALENFLSSRNGLLLALLLAFVWGFWTPPLYDLDEGAFTEATREMMESGNYVSIYLNGEPRHDKPVLIYWLQAASVTVFGLNEFALRLPSVLAAIGWVWALFAFARRFTDVRTANVAAIVLTLALYVSLIAKAAVADALLHLFLALAMFDIYRYSQEPSRQVHLRIFAWLGLGFLTKGPVAVFFPFLVSALFYLSYGRWKDWLKQVFDPAGLAIFVAIVLPWHIAVYLDTGWAFFEGFYLHHNVSRYADPMEGHSGGIFYYVFVAPLVLMPFAVWFITAVTKMGRVKDDALDRYLWIWFFSVLIVFSFSGTKLPHYLLYGMSGVVLLMARARDSLRLSWLHALPVLLLLGFFASLPQLFAALVEETDKAYDRLMFEGGAEVFAGLSQNLAIGVFVLAVVVFFLRIPLWQRMLLIGYLQAGLVSLVILPGVMGVLQDGPKAAALFAKEQGKELVFNRHYQPSVSVYSEQIIRHQTPKPGQWVYVRTDRLQRFLDKPSPYAKRVVFSQGPATLVAIDE